LCPERDCTSNQDGTAGTLASNVSESEVHGRYGRRGRRGRAADDRQLGRVQAQILAWLLTEEQRIEAAGTDEERARLSRRGITWMKVSVKIGESPSAVSAALRGARQRSLVERGLVAITTTRGGRVSHARLTPLGRAAAQEVATGSSRRHVTDDIRSRYRATHGPRASWSQEVAQAEQREIKQALDALHIAALRLGRPVVNLTLEELGQVLDAVERDRPARTSERGESATSFAQRFARLVVDYVKHRSQEGYS
jgi:hypothetical protein